MPLGDGLNDCQTIIRENPIAIDYYDRGCPVRGQILRSSRGIGAQECQCRSVTSKVAGSSPLARAIHWHRKRLVKLFNAAGRRRGRLSPQQRVYEWCAPKRSDPPGDFAAEM